MKNLITCLVVCVLSSVVAAEIHHVPADFPTIQHSVDAALDGDEIIVMPGTYTSTADEVVDMRGKEIWLHSSAGAELTIIDGEEKRRGIFCSNGETPNTIIEGFTITNGYSGGGVDYYHGGGMYNVNSSPTLTNCTLCSNTPNQISGTWSDEGGNTVAEICPIEGACCTNDTCVDSQEDGCNLYGGSWLGEGTTCEDNPCPTSCLGDVTGDGQVNVSDLLLVISVWGACP